jgi:accessory gene regulator protein AgrB
MKNFMLAALSRIIQGIGCGVVALSLLAIVWFMFYSDDSFKYLWVATSIAGIFLGYFIFRFAVKKIHDGRPD